MGKHARERARRAQQSERVREIQAAWFGSLTTETATDFTRRVEAARARGPLQPPPDMAPGTAPNPPRPGREPKPPKDDRNPRRRSH
jgi:hypothetical protein